MLNIWLLFSQMVLAQDTLFLWNETRAIEAEGAFESCILTSNGETASFRLERNEITGAYYVAELGEFRATIHHNFNRGFETVGPTSCQRNQFIVEIQGPNSSITLSEDDLDLNLSVALQMASTESAVFSTILGITKGFLGELKWGSRKTAKVICSLGV